jgi:aspartate/methionine/tyrosine aminotransferase
LDQCIQNMQINDFNLERYFAKYEFKARHLLSSSDCESVKVSELIQMADPECLDLWQNLRLGYTETKGHPLLRKEISDLYKNIKTEDIIVMAPEEGIFIAMNVLLNPGDHVIALDPLYQSLSEIPRAIGCEVTKWPVILENNQWNLDISFLQDNIKKNTKIIIINFPHNPTGFIPEADDFKSIVEIARKNKIYLFSDEMYRYLEFSGSHRHESVCDLYDNGIVLSGLSKSFGLPGLRTGWLATRNNEILKKFENFKDYTTICNGALSEIISIIALRNKDQITGRNLDLIRENLIIVKAFFAKHKDFFSWIETKGSSVAFPILTESIPADDFCKKLIDQKSIMLLPGSIFNYPGNHFRVGLGKKDFKEILGELDSFLDAY